MYWFCFPLFFYSLPIFVSCVNFGDFFSRRNKIIVLFLSCCVIVVEMRTLWFFTNKARSFMGC